MSSIYSDYGNDDEQFSQMKSNQHNQQYSKRTNYPQEPASTKYGRNKKYMGNDENRIKTLTIDLDEISNYFKSQNEHQKSYRDEEMGYNQPRQKAKYQNNQSNFNQSNFNQSNFNQKYDYQNHYQNDDQDDYNNNFNSNYNRKEIRDPVVAMTRYQKPQAINNDYQDYNMSPPNPPKKKQNNPIANMTLIEKRRNIMVLVLFSLSFLASIILQGYHYTTSNRGAFIAAFSIESFVAVSTLVAVRIHNYRNLFSFLGMFCCGIASAVLASSQPFWSKTLEFISLLFQTVNFLAVFSIITTIWGLEW